VVLVLKNVSIFEIFLLRYSSKKIFGEKIKDSLPNSSVAFNTIKTVVSNNSLQIHEKKKQKQKQRTLFIT
jgi:hypothetical protein